MRSIVTGGAGFIGHHLVYRLLQEGDEVIVIDNLDTGLYQNVFNATRKDFSKRFYFYQADLCDRLRTDNIFLTHKPDRVFHLAAMGSVPRSVSDPILVTQNNVMSTAIVLDASVRHKVQRFVHSSSASVYGNGGESSLKREDDELLPENPYAVTKLFCERLVRVYGTVFKLPTVSLRYFNVFGPGQSLKGSYPAVIPAWIQAIKKGDPIIIHGSGEQTRDFTYVDNVVEANLLASTHTMVVPGIAYNIGCNKRTSILKLAELVLSEVNVPVTIAHGPERRGDIQDNWANIYQAKLAFGYDPKVDVQEGVKRTVAWYMERQE